MTKKIKQPPAKGRYDEKNPVLGVRLPKEYRDKLDSLTAARGITLTDFIKGILDDEGQGESYNKGHEAGCTKGSEEGYAKGSEAGYAKGYKEGRAKGSKEGYTKGHKEGYTEGHVDGFVEGWDEGEENERQANEDAKKPHFVCGNCNRRSILGKSLIKTFTESGAFVECPECHRQDIFLFEGNPSLEKMCRELSQSRKPNVAVEGEEIVMIDGIPRRGFNVMNMPQFKLLRKSTSEVK